MLPLSARWANRIPPGAAPFLALSLLPLMSRGLSWCGRWRVCMMRFMSAKSQQRGGETSRSVGLGTRFRVGDHVLLVTKVAEGRWVVAVDEEHALDASFANQAEAWEAGVREADRRDRLSATPGTGGGSQSIT